MADKKSTGSRGQKVSVIGSVDGASKMRPVKSEQKPSSKPSKPPSKEK